MSVGRLYPECRRCGALLGARRHRDPDAAEPTWECWDCNARWGVEVLDARR